MTGEKKEKGMREMAETKEGKKKISISLTTQILIATIGGIVFGALVGEWAGNLKFIGDIFLRLIQMSVVLLVMSSVAAAVGGGDGKDVGKMGVHTIKWDRLFYSDRGCSWRDFVYAGQTGAWNRLGPERKRSLRRLWKRHPCRIRC